MNPSEEPGTGTASRSQSPPAAGESALPKAETVQKTLFRRGSWKTRVETRTRFTSTEDHFVLRAELKAYEDEKEFFAA